MNPLLPKRLAFPLLTELASGNYREGERFLSTRKIIRTWGVSSQTAARALNLLEEWGLLTSVDRSGHYLAEGFRQKALLRLEAPQQASLPPRLDWVGKARGTLHAKEPLRRIAVVIQCDVVTDAGETRPDVLLSNLPPYSFTHCSQAIFHTAMKHNTAVSLFIDDTSTASQKRILRQIRHQRAQGVIILKYVQASEVSTLAQPLLRQGLPVVVLFNDCANTNMSAINFNNIAMGHTALKVLTDAGHRRIGVAIPPREETPFYFKERFEGCQLAAKDAPFPVTLHPIIPEEDNPTANVRFAPLFAKNNPKRVTAVFFTSFHLLRNLQLAFQQAQLTLPEDLSLIACSNTRHSSYINTPIDILHMNFEEVGSRAYATLHDLYGGNAIPRISLIDCPYQAHGSVLECQQPAAV